MGVSTNALFFWGIALDEEEIDMPWGDEEDWEEHYASLHGINRPEVEWVEIQNENAFGKQYETATTEQRQALDAYYEAKKALITESPYEVIYHCSLDYPLVAVVLKRTHVSASRGYPTEVEMSVISEEEVAGLIPFITKLKLPYAGEMPKWQIASMWG